jgi:hypothetical protein
MHKLPLGIFTPLAVFLGCIAQARSYDGVHWQVGKYSIDVARMGPADEWSSLERLSISTNGKAVYKLEGQRVFTDWKDFMYTDAPGSIKPPERDVASPQDPLHLGTPTLVAVDWSGGAHCCFTLHIVMLGDHIRPLPVIELFDASEIGFMERPSRKQVVLLIQDRTFNYWHAPFAFSSAVEVPYSFNTVRKRYLPDAELMRRPVPSDAVLATWRDEARAADINEADVPRAITQRVLELIYSGHLATARSFLTSVWPHSKEQQTRYWDDLTKCQIKFSPAWQAIAELNGLDPDKHTSGCQKRF